MQGLPGLQTFLQALQPTQFVYTGNPFMPPQYPAMAPMPAQAPPLAQLPAPENHPIFQALVAAASEQAIKKINERQAPAAPANMSPEDEKVLVDVLKKGEENKWSMERVFHELSKKHGYTQEVWMKWFAMNVAKLYPIAFPAKANSKQLLGGHANANANGGSSGSSSQATSGERSTSSNRQPTTTVRFAQEQPQARARKVVITTPKPPTGSAAPAKSSTTSNNASVISASRTRSANPQPPVLQNTSSAAPTRYSASRSKRGGSVPIVHDQTLIPWTDGSIKPSPPGPPAPQASAKVPLPRRTPGPISGNGGDASTKFTQDEKVFFVHWLRWRLRREGPLPEKETLFEELAAEHPPRSAEAWKRYWAANGEVPDALWIQARKRADGAREHARLGGGSESPLTPLGDGERSESESESSGDDEDDESASSYHPSARKPVAPAATKTTKAAPKPAHPPNRLPVTDEDLRAMARYRLGKAGDWENPDIPHKSFWRAFAERPENDKRSWDAWNSIGRDPKHSTAIAKYVEELASRQTTAAAPRSTGKFRPAGLQAPAPQRQITPGGLQAIAPRPTKPGPPPTAPQPTKPGPAIAPQQAKPAGSPSGAAKQPLAGDSKPVLKRPAPAADLDTASASASASASAAGAGKDDPPSPSKRQKTAGDDVNPQADVDVVDLTADSDGDGDA